MKFIFFEAQKTAEILHNFDEIYVKCILEKEILQNNESFSCANLQNEHARAADPGRPQWLVTARGIGYKLAGEM